MSDSIELVVGLGNPGDRYADTRHNAGFQFLDRLGSALRRESKFSADVGRTTIDGHSVWLLRPRIYMNHSGDALAAFANFYKIPAHQILVVHDELDLSPGSVRLKLGGGHGGHNGLRDIIDRFGSADFVRLRIGIGHPGSSKVVESYVLKKAPAAEARLTQSAIDAAFDELPTIIRGEFEPVMNALHTKAK